MKTCELYIDADNQHPDLATSLARSVKPMGDFKRIEIRIVGNAKPQVRRWCMALEARFNNAIIHEHLSSYTRKQSADALLMLHLGRLFHEAPDRNRTVVIVSRDAHFLAACDILRTLGHRILLAVQASQAQIDLPTLALAA